MSIPANWYGGGQARKHLPGRYRYQTDAYHYGMDLIWTIGLLVVGYFGYNWYTGLQQQVRGGEPDDRVTGPEAPPKANNGTPPSADDTDYIDYEELE